MEPGGWLATLLLKVLDLGLSQLVEAALGDEPRQLRDRILGKTHEKELRSTFSRAYTKTLKSAKNPEIDELLNHRPFQEAVAAGLLDMERPFDLNALAQEWGEKLPSLRVPLQLFFNALQSALLTDKEWGPVVDRFQQLRSSQEAQRTLVERGYPTDISVLVQQASVNLYGPGVVVQGGQANITFNITNVQVEAGVYRGRLAAHRPGKAGDLPGSGCPHHRQPAAARYRHRHCGSHQRAKSQSAW